MDEKKIVADDPTEAEISKLLWKNNNRCVVRMLCGVADDFGIVLTKDLIEALITEYEKEAKAYSDKARAADINDFRSVEVEIDIIRTLVKKINEELSVRMPFPQETSVRSLDDIISLLSYNEIAVFIAAHPGYPRHHVFHFGHDMGVDKKGIFFQNRFEAVFKSMIEQGFVNNAVRVFIFPRAVE